MWFYAIILCMLRDVVFVLHELILQKGDLFQWTSSIERYHTAHNFYLILVSFRSIQEYTIIYYGEILSGKFFMEHGKVCELFIIFLHKFAVCRPLMKPLINVVYKCLLHVAEAEMTWNLHGGLAGTSERHIFEYSWFKEG